MVVTCYASIDSKSEPLKLVKGNEWASTLLFCSRELRGLCGWIRLLHSEWSGGLRGRRLAQAPGEHLIILILLSSLPLFLTCLGCCGVLMVATIAPLCTT